MNHSDSEEMIKWLDNLDYDPKTGNLFWKIPIKKKQKPGSLVGHVNSKGYVMIAINKIRRPAHRVIWRLMTGSWPSETIDHIDGNRLNNSWGNLREASIAQNCLNSKSSTGNPKGVYPHKGRYWIVKIGLNGKRHYFGLFKNYEKACEVAKKERIRLHGVFARHQ